MPEIASCIIYMDNAPVALSTKLSAWEISESTSARASTP